MTETAKSEEHSPGLVLRQNHLGQGVYSTKLFAKGDLVMIFGGELIHESQMPSVYFGSDDRFMQVDVEYFLGPSGRLDDYTNHSCRPNTGVKFAEGEVRLVAIKQIKPQDEITWDYSTTLLGQDWRMHCECRQVNCRGIVGDFTTLASNVQKKYYELDVVAPYIRRLYERTIQSHSALPSDASKSGNDVMMARRNG